MKKTLCVFLVMLMCFCALPSIDAYAEDIELIEEDNYTILWTSDPQWYSFAYQEILIDQNEWVIENFDRLNVKYIIHTGDFVDLPHNRDQWGFVTDQYKKWDDSGLPYGVLAGNHDVDGTDYTEFGEYFGAARFENNDWYGESYENNRGHYDLMTIDGTDFIFVYLGYGDHTEADYKWINGVLEKHADRIAFISFHEYLYANGTRTETGNEIFDKVVLKNPNVRMVMCGHNYNATRLVEDIDDNGDGIADRTVYQLMANYQNLENGGNGYMRFLEFDKKDGTVAFRTYSPYLNDFNAYENRGDEMDEYGYRDEFTIPFDFTAPKAKEKSDPEKGTVILNATAVFGDTEKTALPLNYINTAENGASYNNAGIYDRTFSLDARDAVKEGASVNYIVIRYKDKIGYRVSDIIYGNDSASVPAIPQDGRVIVVAEDAKDKADNEFDINSISVGQAVTFSQLSGVISPLLTSHANIVIDSIDRTFNIDGANRTVKEDELIIFDSTWGKTTFNRDDDNKWNMIFTFSPVDGAKNKYTLTAASTVSGEAKEEDIPVGGFAMIMNTASYESSFRASMRKVLTVGSVITLNGYLPGEGYVYEGESIISADPSDWSYDNTTLVVEKSSENSLVLYNTDGLWPDARYNLKSPITFDPENALLHYELELEADSKTSILLFCSGSTPASFAEGQYIKINSLLAGVTISAGSGDIKGDGSKISGTLDLSTVEFPDGCYNEDGTVTVSGIKIFASGKANTKVIINRLLISTNGDGEESDAEESIAADKSEADTSAQESVSDTDKGNKNNVVIPIVIVLIAVVAVAVLVTVKLKKK
ncbi:MAG: metallophosphoesterase [Clostridia bacterium]|nr:metallophosphoesterase [Clostridia bacterium]